MTENIELHEVLEPLQKGILRRTKEKTGGADPRRKVGGLTLPLFAIFTAIALGASFLAIDGVFLTELRKKDRGGSETAVSSRTLATASSATDKDELRDQQRIPHFMDVTDAPKSLKSLKSDADIIEYFSLPPSRALVVFEACQFNAKNAATNATNLLFRQCEYPCFYFLEEGFIKICYTHTGRIQSVSLEPGAVVQNAHIPVN